MIVSPDPWQLLPVDWREKVAARWPDAERLTWAWRLARDLDTCADLLAGLPVSQGRLNQDALLEARRLTLVQLRAPIELVDGVEDEA